MRREVLVEVVLGRCLVGMRVGSEDKLMHVLDLFFCFFSPLAGNDLVNGSIIHSTWRDLRTRRAKDG